jgi:AcrR family transcriptional regulator
LSALDEPEDWRVFAPLPLDPVLTSAIAAFVSTGYHGATMRSIAHGAAMSVHGVYHHYRSKQDLLVAILDMTMSELLLRVTAARDEGTTTPQRFALMVEALALFHTHRRDLAFIGASETRSLQHDNRHQIAALRDRLQHMLDAEVDTAISEGRFTTPYAHTATRAISTMCTSLPQWFRLDGPLKPEQIATEYAQFALDLMRDRST